jgi:L-malate glycosyltransferase
MKTLVFAHRLQIGGTQVNAIELAARLRQAHGHEIVLFAAPGPMDRLIEEKGLRHRVAPDATYHPSLARMVALRRAIAAEKPDVLHVWDWWQCLDAYYGAHLVGRTPMVVSDMQSESINRLLPKSLLTTFGTPQFVQQARERGRAKVGLLLPPVDTVLNAPGAVDATDFKFRWGIIPGDVTVVIVSRLVQHLKGESLRRAIDAVRKLGRSMPLRLIIVGEGHARPELERLAGVVNAHLGRDAIVFTGPLLDPRPAYAAADIVLGMGGSALRGLAFAKPVLVVGTNAFSAPFTPETAEHFYYHGFFGSGDGDPENSRLATQLSELAQGRARNAELGEFGRLFVLKHFSLAVVASRLDGYLRAAAAEPYRLGPSAADAFRTAAVMAAGKLRRSLRWGKRVSVASGPLPEWSGPSSRIQELPTEVLSTAGRE